MAHLIAWTSWFGHGGPGFGFCLPLSWFIVTLHGQVYLPYLCNLSTQGLIWELEAHETSWLCEWKSISTVILELCLYAPQQVDDAMDCTALVRV